MSTTNTITFHRDGSSVAFSDPFWFAYLPDCRPIQSMENGSRLFTSGEEACEALRSAGCNPDEMPEARFVYRNHRGEVAERRVIPSAIRFGTSNWHPQAQWLLDAFDLDKQAARTFAMKDILEWRPGV